MLASLAKRVTLTVLVWEKELLTERFKSIFKYIWKLYSCLGLTSKCKLNELLNFLEIFLWPEVPRFQILTIFFLAKISFLDNLKIFFNVKYLKNLDFLYSTPLVIWCLSSRLDAIGHTDHTEKRTSKRLLDRIFLRNTLTTLFHQNKIKKHKHFFCNFYQTQLLRTQTLSLDR